MLVLCQKLHICTYNRQNILVTGPLWKLVASTGPRKVGAKTVPASTHPIPVTCVEPLALPLSAFLVISGVVPKPKKIFFIVFVQIALVVLGGMWCGSNSHSIPCGLVSGCYFANC